MAQTDDDDEINAVIIDNGSGVIKVGFAGEEAPTTTFTSIVGRHKYPGFEPFDGPDRKRRSFVGDEAQNRRGILSLRYPIEHGVVTDWDDMEEIWEHALYSRLRCSADEIPILVSEAPMNPRTNREKMTQIFFEKFSAQKFFVANDALLSHYAIGRSISVQVDIGDGVTSVVPFYEGSLIPHAASRSNLAGRDLTHYMIHALNERGYTFATTAEREIVRNIKERLCYVAPDFHLEMLSWQGMSSSQSSMRSKEKSYELPDRQIVMVGSEQFLCPEILFQPSLLRNGGDTGVEHRGIHELVHDTIMRCDVDLRRDFFFNVVLSGASTMFSGFEQRLEKELLALVEPAMRVRVVAKPDRDQFVWVGGSILASLTTFQELWITKQEYEEHGPRIVHDKCKS